MLQRAKDGPTIYCNIMGASLNSKSSLLESHNQNLCINYVIPCMHQTDKNTYSSQQNKCFRGQKMDQPIYCNVMGASLNSKRSLMESHDQNLCINYIICIKPTKTRIDLIHNFTKFEGMRESPTEMQLAQGILVLLPQGSLSFLYSRKILMALR